jgi:hypothetical protein
VAEKAVSTAPNACGTTATMHAAFQVCPKHSVHVITGQPGQEMPGWCLQPLLLLLLLLKMLLLVGRAMIGMHGARHVYASTIKACSWAEHHSLSVPV